MYRDRKGFSLVEFSILITILALILSVAIPNFRALNREGQLAKAEQDLVILMNATISYWRHNQKTYPADVSDSLSVASPAVITGPLVDPWSTDSERATYGFNKGSDPRFGDYFVIFTKGPDGDTQPRFNASTQSVEYQGSGMVVSNAPVNKI